MTKLDREERAEAVRALRRWFKEERGEDVGDLAAGMLLDLIEEQIAPTFYNKGLDDAKAAALKVQAALEEEVDALKAAPRSRR